MLDHGANRDLRIREQLLHCIREQVRGRVTNHVEAIGILVGDDGEIGVTINQVRGIDQLAIDLAGQRGLRQAGADRRSDLRDRDGRLELAL